MPVGAESFSDALRWGTEVFHTLKGVLKKKGYNTAVGDEGGFAPNLKSNDEALELILEAIQPPATSPAKTSPSPSTPPPASSTTKTPANTSSRNPTSASSPPPRWPPSGSPGSTNTPSSPSKTASPKTTGTAGSYLTEAIGDKVQLVGDDLFVTNTKRLQQGIDQKVANSILIKVNQIGTVSETLDAIELARRFGYTSHHQPPLRRNRRHLHRRPRRRHQRRPDQNRLRQPHRPHRQIQPAPPHRRRTRPIRRIPRHRIRQLRRITHCP